MKASAVGVPQLHDVILDILQDKEPMCALDIVNEIEKQKRMMVEKRHVQKCLYTMLETAQVKMKRYGAKPFWSRSIITDASTLDKIALDAMEQVKMPAMTDYDKLWNRPSLDSRPSQLRKTGRRHSLPSTTLPPHLFGKTFEVDPSVFEDKSPKEEKKNKKNKTIPPVTRENPKADDARESKTDTRSRSRYASCFAAPLPDYIPFQRKPKTSDSLPTQEKRERKTRIKQEIENRDTLPSSLAESDDEKEKQEGYCDVCHITTTSRTNLEQHNQGKAHAKNYFRMEMLQSLDRSRLKTAAERTMAPSTPARYLGPNIQYTRNPISELNEISMKRGLVCRFAEESSDISKPHLPVFTILVTVGNKIKARGTASSKSEARRLAAMEALEILKENR